ncbi:MAG: bacteriophage CI repressor [Desulfobacterales bacterium]|nr:bacteriophage CI repressor [Desulfobacterales bacterium]
MKFQEFWERIKSATDIRTQGDLASILGVRQATVSDAKKRNSVPAEWLMKLYQSHKLNPVWLAHGIGPVHIQQECESSEKYMLNDKGGIYGRLEESVIDIDMLTQIIESMEKYLLKKQRVLSPIKKARLTALLYEHFKAAKKGVDNETIERYVDLAD